MYVVVVYSLIRGVPRVLIKQGAMDASSRTYRSPTVTHPPTSPHSPPPPTTPPLKKMMASSLCSGHQGDRASVVSKPPPSRRSVFLASGLSPLLRLASSGAAFAAGSGHVASSPAPPPPDRQGPLGPQVPARVSFGEKEMQRYDRSSDFIFYSQPRFVRHIDDDAIRALTKYSPRCSPQRGGRRRHPRRVQRLGSATPRGTPPGASPGSADEGELKKNPVLTDYVVRDLNENPELPHEDNTFDVVTNAVSVDYLTRPLEMMKEVRLAGRSGDHELQQRLPHQGGNLDGAGPGSHLDRVLSLRGRVRGARGRTSQAG